MDTNTNALNWFEIPVSDLDRARKFYETIFNIRMDEVAQENFTMATFPYQPGSGKAAGALVKSNMHKPSADGVIVYLNGNPDLQTVLDRIGSAGGTIHVPKTQISEEIGFMAFFEDTEGNKVALHSQN